MSAELRDARQVVECIEPHRRPARRALAVEDGGSFGLFALPTMPGRDGLRRTVLRAPDADPPAGAVPVATLLVDATGLVATNLAADVVLELQRAGTRRQVVSGMRLPVHGLYELTLPDGSRTSFALNLQRRLERGATHGVSGSGTRASQAVDSGEDNWWILNDGPDLIVHASRLAYEWVTDKLKATGINQEILLMAMGVAIAFLVGGGLALWQYMQAQEAQARADEAAEALALAEAAQAASVATEMACLQDRQALLAELGRRQEARALRVKEALDLTLARQAAIEIGGMRMASEPLRKLDLLLEPNLVGTVQGRMAKVTPGADASACLAQSSVLGTELPAWLLLWHPDPRLTCPVDYSAEDAGVRHVGRWGLSDRVAREFGGAGHLGTGTTPASLEGVLEDPRTEDRWSAHTLAAAYREVLHALLRTRRTERPPVLPAQTHLWALALLDAYNRLPSPVGGALDVPAAECVNRALEEIARRAQPAAPGTPLLPDLAAVAATSVDVPLTPTPGCAWPQEALRLGAEAALQAVARRATLAEEAVTGEAGGPLSALSP